MLSNQHFLAVLGTRGWMVPAIAVVTALAAFGFTLLQPPVFAAQATMVVELDESFQGQPEAVTALGRLVRTRELPATFVQIATSRNALERAAAKAGVDSTEVQTLDVQARFLPRSNVLEIRVLGEDPGVLAPIANEVGGITGEIIHHSLQVYTLRPLDSASVPAAAQGPNRWLSVALGIGVGLLLGSAVFCFSLYQAPTPQELELVSR
jgi:uncharacterized protein involved in exopolysaccharide biosynthesis